MTLTYEIAVAVSGLPTLRCVRREVPDQASPHIPSTMCAVDVIPSLHHESWSTQPCLGKLSSSTTVSSPARTLNESVLNVCLGRTIPSIAYGTWTLGNGQSTIDNVDQALDTGFDHIGKASLSVSTLLVASQNAFDAIQTPRRATGTNKRQGLLSTRAG